MKIQAIQTCRYVNGRTRCTQQQPFVNDKRQTAEKLPYFPIGVPFLGYNVHIFDGGAHAENMKYFAQSLNDKIDVQPHEVETNKKAVHNKQMASLYEALKEIPSKQTKDPEYIALPGLFEISIQNLEAQYKKVMYEDISLTPQNIKSNKEKLLSFLEELASDPEGYKKYIKYLDPNNQGLIYVPQVVKEINRLKSEGYKVYIPSGHPEYQTLNWLAEEKGKKPELYHYIATGEDADGTIQSLRNHIQKNGWYDFNILNLSDAEIINLKDVNGKEDYIYAAYDSTITGGERGVYNFYPVRDTKGSIIGYSYHNKKDVEYPYDDFPANEEISNISKFVGRNLEDVLATQEETEYLKTCIDNQVNVPNRLTDKLYKVEDVFTQYEMYGQKINLRGNYTDSTRKLFFDTNSNNEVIFPNCDCEGSKRPSVMSMWGGCFSIFNAISKDINYREKEEEAGLNYYHKVSTLLNNGRYATERGFYRSAEDYYNNAIELTKTCGIENETPYIELGKLHMKKEDYKNASSCYNNAINILSRKFVASGKSVMEIGESIRKFVELKQAEINYEKELEEYLAKSKVYRFLIPEPQKPEGSINNYREDIEINEMIETIAGLYGNLSEICSKQGEDYPSEVCKAASNEISNHTEKANKVIKARADGIEYIGDIFNEIKPY